MWTPYLFLFFSLFLALSYAEFDDNWAASATCQSGKQQSPLDIVSAAAVYDEAKGNVQFNWEKSATLKEITVHNDGMTVFSEGITFSENTLMDGVKYNVQIVNSHWSAPGEKDSEHAIDGVKYDGELEFIHMRDDLTDFGKAFETPGGIIVVSILMQEDASIKYDQQAVNDFKNTLTHIIPAGSQITIPWERSSLILKNLLPDSSAFYRYTGSITVNPCFEGIERIVLKEPLKISPKVLDRYRHLNSKKGGKLTKSVNRPLQHLNGRTIYKNFQ